MLDMRLQYQINQERSK